MAEAQVANVILPTATESNFDITLVGKFEVNKLNPDASVPRMVWLDHAIYVTYDNLRSVRVFKDESPFTELPPIQIEDLVMPDSMVACAWRHKIYIGVSQESIIWKIDFTNNASVIKLPMDLMGTPVHLSITADNNLMAVVVRFCAVQQVGDELQFEVDALDNLVYNAGGTRAFHYLEIHRQTDHARAGMIRLPEDFERVGCVVQSKDLTFIVSYQRDLKSSEFYISALSSNCENIIWTMVTAFFTTHSQPNVYPYYFIIDQEGDGDIFLAAKCENRVFLMNSQGTKYNTISARGYRANRPTQMVYRKQIHCLLVQDSKITDQAQSTSHYHPVVSILRLSPRSPNQQRDIGFE